MPNNKHHNLSIALLKEQFTAFDKIIRGSFQIENYDISGIGTLYIKRPVPNPPKWLSFFKDVIDVENIGKNAAVSAALLVRSEGRIFAITFGQGRSLLQADSWVERFGLRVALNSIGKEKIRTIDKSTFDAIYRHSKEQASKETDAGDFGFDIEQDLLRAVTGVPKNRAIGTKIYGMDFLNVSTDTLIEKIDGYLQQIYALFTDNTYKSDFPWVDHIGEIKDKTMVDELDAMLVSQIKSAKIDKIWMAVPEIIGWDKVGGFAYKMSKGSPEYPDIHLQDFIKSLSVSEKEALSKDTFTRKHVRCVNTEGYQMHEWQAYKCLYCELEKETTTYLLSGGKWYAVESSFVASVNRSYSDIPNYEVKLPKYNDESETNYNERVSREMADQFTLMDRKNISIEGTHSPIEFCDLFSRNRDIIHVKRYGTSSVLSHLFAQGKTSGELFLMEKEFREKVAERLPDGFKIEKPQDRPKGDDYQVVYAIISNAPGELNIPFFSKLNLKNSARALHGWGYKVAKLKIDVDDRKAKLEVYRERGRK